MNNVVLLQYHEGIPATFLLFNTVKWPCGVLSLPKSPVGCPLVRYSELDGMQVDLPYMLCEWFVFN